MDFDLGEGAEKVRAELGRFLERHFDDEARDRARRNGDGHDWALFRLLAEEGWVSAAWPEEVGGQGRSAYEMLVFQWELAKQGFPWIGLLNNQLIGQTLLALGTEEQKREIVPKVVSGEIVLALGYSEPGVGSDVASVETRARRSGDDWVIEGQKMWTTLGHLSKYIFTLCRSDPDLPRHKGLTMFLVPTDVPEVEIHPVHTMGGERTNIVYLNQVRVPDSARVGEVNGGWAVVRHALSMEQGTGFADLMEMLVEQATEWAAASGLGGRRPLDDPGVRERLAQAAIHAEVAKLLRYRSAWVHTEGRKEPAAGPMAKLFSGEKYTQDATALMELVGVEALLEHGAPGAPAAGAFAATCREVPVTTIYGGSSEILRSLIAEAGLGLPRSR